MKKLQKLTYVWDWLPWPHLYNPTEDIHENHDVAAASEIRWSR